MIDYKKFPMGDTGKNSRIDSDDNIIKFFVKVRENRTRKQAIKVTSKAFGVREYRLVEIVRGYK